MRITNPRVHYSRIENPTERENYYSSKFPDFDNASPIARTRMREGLVPQ